MPIKLAALDMDGTLLNRRKLVSERNRLAVHKALSMGVYVTIATGRMPVSAAYFARQLNMNCPVISCNGGVVQPLDGSAPIFEAHFPPATVRSLIEMCYAENWHLRWYIGDAVYVREYDSRMFPAYVTTKGLDIRPIGDDYAKYVNDVTQLVVCDYHHHIRSIYEQIAAEFSGRIGLQQNTGYSMDITPPGITKSVGLAKLAEHLGIARDEIMAIGDGDNDLTMIEYAGTGVAMENAIDEAKQIAQFTTKDCDDDGVAYAFEKLVLGGE